MTQENCNEFACYPYLLSYISFLASISDNCTLVFANHKTCCLNILDCFEQCNYVSFSHCLKLLSAVLLDAY